MSEIVDNAPECGVPGTTGWCGLWFDLNLQPALSRLQFGNEFARRLIRSAES